MKQLLATLAAAVIALAPLAVRADSNHHQSGYHHNASTDGRHAGTYRRSDDNRGRWHESGYANNGSAWWNTGTTPGRHHRDRDDRTRHHRDTH